MAAFTVFKGYSKAKLSKMTDFSAKSRNGKKKQSFPSAYLWSLEPFSIVLSTRLEKYNYYSKIEKIRKVAEMAFSKLTFFKGLSKGKWYNSGPFFNKIQSAKFKVRKEISIMS